jgi:hypothetical protein
MKRIESPKKETINIKYDHQLFVGAGILKSMGGIRARRIIGMLIKWGIYFFIKEKGRGRWSDPSPEKKINVLQLHSFR